METKTEADMLRMRLLKTLTESQARWYVASEAVAMGRGGIAAMHQRTGMSWPTILRGIRELRSGRTLTAADRVRRPGGGRKALEYSDPGLTAALERIMDENTAGDPMSLLRWTHKSTRQIARELTASGHPVSYKTVGRRLIDLDYSLQVNAKSLEATSPPERDAQFRYINRQVHQQLARGEPVLSIDTKKKEKVGLFRNSGRSYRPKGKPRAVNVYDFKHLSQGTAIPYGAYDLDRNEGFVNVGMSHDTAEFAVESLRQWWKLVGRRHYPQAKSVLLCADGGGSNSSRTRAWKYHLQRLADDLGLSITVCHYPPGTSKWNKIEHRMFSFISMNWAGEPLASYETVVKLIGSTTTRQGLRIKARLDAKAYATNVQISDEQMQSVHLEPHKTHPQWNYTIIGKNG
jgi:hypothetical protein